LLGVVVIALVAWTIEGMSGGPVDAMAIAMIVLPRATRLARMHDVTDRELPRLPPLTETSELPELFFDGAFALDPHLAGIV
jgi:hypothetical protein